MPGSGQESSVGPGLKTGKTTGTKAYGAAGGNAVGMGAPGFGSPAQTQQTLKLMGMPNAVWDGNKFVNPPQGAQLGSGGNKTVASAPASPVVKPVVQTSYPGYLGPNSPLAQASLPQVGGTNPAVMSAAINGSGTAGAWGNQATPVNGSGTGPGGAFSGNPPGGKSQTVSGPGKTSLPSTTINKMPASIGPPSMAQSLASGNQTVINKNDIQPKPADTGLMYNYKTYANTPQFNQAEPGENPITASAPPGLEQFGPIDQYKNYINKPNPKSITDQIQQSPNSVVGKWYGQPSGSNIKTNWNWTGLGQMNKTGQTVTPSPKPMTAGFGLRNMPR